MKMIFTLSLMLLATALGAQDPPLQDSVLQNPPVVIVDPDKAQLELALDPAAIILDVRFRFEFRRGHIEKAVNLPTNKSLNEFAASTSKGRPLYVYCTTEPRSRQAAARLLEHGFSRVFVIEGGLNKWRAYNLPIVTGRKGRKDQP